MRPLSHEPSSMIFLIYIEAHQINGYNSLYHEAIQLIIKSMTSYSITNHSADRCHKHWNATTELNERSTHCQLCSAAQCCIKFYYLRRPHHSPQAAVSPTHLVKCIHHSVFRGFVNRAGQIPRHSP